MRFFRAIIPIGFLLGVVSFAPFVSYAHGAQGVQGSQGAQPSATTAQRDASPAQRTTILRSRLESMRRSINSALAALNADEDKSDKTATLDTPRSRLRGLEEDVGSLLSDVTDIKSKQDRGDKYDVSEIDQLEIAVADLNTRVDSGLRDIAGLRREPLTSTPASDTPTDTVSNTSKKNTKKKKTGFLSGIFGRGEKEGEYADLTGGSAPGRDKTLFETAVKEAHRGRFEESRLLFNVIITTYPESDFLPLAKLAIADTFYLEGVTSSLIQAGASYQDWLTFFPTDPLADDVMLKIVETEMRQMGLPERANTNAIKAEQRLRVLFQQFPNTELRPQAELRLREVQENLGFHSLSIGNFYFERYSQGKANSPRGAQSRYLDIVKNYPNFSRMDEVLYKLGVTYQQQEEPDEASKYLQQLVRNYPNCKYVEKAIEQLNTMGSSVPDPDPERKDLAPPEKASMPKRFIGEVFGSADVTVTKDGVLISQKDKDNDLISQVLKNNGRLPLSVTDPNAKEVKSEPAKQSVQITPVKSNEKQR